MEFSFLGIPQKQQAQRSHSLSPGCRSSLWSQKWACLGCRSLESLMKETSSWTMFQHGLNDDYIYTYIYISWYINIMIYIYILNVFLPVFCLFVSTINSKFWKQGLRTRRTFFGPKSGLLSSSLQRPKAWWKVIFSWQAGTKEVSESVDALSLGQNNIPRKTINLIRHVSAILIFEYGCTKSMYRVT